MMSIEAGDGTTDPDAAPGDPPVSDDCVGVESHSLPHAVGGLVRRGSRRRNFTFRLTR